MDPESALTIDTLLSFLIATVLSPFITEVSRRRTWSHATIRAVCIFCGGALGIGVWMLRGAEMDGLAASVLAGLTAGATATAAVYAAKEVRKEARKPKRKTKPRKEDG